MPKNDVKIKIHFLKFILSPRNNELKIIAKGIDSWAPIVIGAKIEAASIDRYKNIFTPAPIHIENPKSGKKYFLGGIFKLQNGAKHRKSIPILKAPNRIGLEDAIKPNLPIGYALPNKSITKIIRIVCLKDKVISSKTDQE
tara:strand:+ start:310 stop:732 length:423 start_codon:yes stop_codon:yes gene_type:complete